MAVTVFHSRTATGADDPAYDVQLQRDWNAAHVVSVATGTSSGTLATGDDFRFAPAQTIQVAENATTITGQWYSSIKSACDYAATVALTGNRIFIQVYGGEYTESPFTVPAFTFLAGTDEWGAVTISTNDNTVDFINISGNAGVSRFAVIGPTNSGKACLKVTSGTAKASWINFRGGDYGLYVTGGRCMTIGCVTDTGWAGTREFTADGSGAIALLASHAMIGTFTGTYCIHASGNARILADLCVFRTAGGTSIYCQDNAYIRGTALSFVAGIQGIEQQGSGTTVHIGASDFAPGGYTSQMLINGTGTSSFSFSGNANRDLISVTGSITPILNFADDTSTNKGQNAFGEIYVGPNIATGATPLTSFIDAVAQTGRYSGGTVTRVSGRDVIVAAGTAFFDAGQVMKKVTWNTSTITLPSDVDEIWITVDNTGTISSTSVDPDLSTTVVLGEAATSTTDVLFLSNSSLDLGNVPEKLQVWSEEAVGSYVSTGGIVSANGLGFDCSTGTDFIGFKGNTFGATVGATFTYWRGDGGGAWIQTASQTAVNTTQYDDGSGTLATMTASFYRGDLVFIAHTDSGVEFHVLIGQSQWATPSQVKIASFTLPEVLEDNSCRLALLIVQKSAASLTEVFDKRPFGIQHQPTLPPHNILSAGTQVANVTGVVNFANSNSVTFGMSNNSQITASFGQSNQNISLFATGNTTQNSSTILNASSLLFNGLGVASVGFSNGSIEVSVPSGGGAGDGVNILAAGTQTANTTGTVLFSDSNGLAFGMSNSSVITASYSQSTHSHRTEFQAMTLGGNTAGTTTFHASKTDTIFLNGGNNITLSGNGGTVTISGPTLTNSSWTVSDSATSATVGRLAFTASNGLTLTLSTSNNGNHTVIGSYTVPTVTNSSWSVSDAATSGTVGRLAFTNLNGVTLSLSTGAGGSHTIVGSHNALTSQSNQAVSNSAGSFTFQTLNFSNANNVTWGTSAGGIVTASVAAPGAAAEANAINLLGNNTAGNTTATGSTIGWSGLNATLSGTNNSQVVISVPATSSLVGTGGISISTSGSTISISQNNASAYAPFDECVDVTGNQGQATLHIHPLNPLGNVQHDRIALRMFWSNASSVTGSATISNWVGLYTRNASTLSLVSSTSTSNGITFSGTGGNQSLQAGVRVLTIPWTNTITAGEYWMGMLNRTTSGGANGTYNQLLASQLNSNFSGIFGAASNASNQRRLGQGVFSASTTGIPSSVAFSDIRGTASLAHQPPTWFLLSQTA